MIDPRTPELIAYIDTLTNPRDKAIVMHALCSAFPLLRVCNDWMDRIEELEVAMHLTLDERSDLLAEAARVARELKAPSAARAQSISERA